ncbi:FLYWCH-type domain-containing protein [Caenorhabditis elegans]|uniref:FLYWCH-type domain-containing protein n=1 Tax=Caenorhabditis elegans TaxID=6239 RepID=O62038_CAEEL|nr:FLYWCH-type domain-containing protein [Caenorhabditis elegans]CAA86413.1 FLYWCH-type domain-containing protein [Caenorhabditis elegans]|eukprot:NP_509601.1 Uncharacterized protein CELE_C07B5.6 [Caenorhabditis elegans]
MFYQKFKNESNGASTSSHSHLPTLPESAENDVSHSEGLEFGEMNSAEYTSSSYISFGEPVFTTNILVNQPNCIDQSVMEASQNFNTFNYPVFKKYGYYIDGVYYTMVKKGSTRQRVKCLYRRGIPRLETIKEEPEKEDHHNADKRDQTNLKNDTKV